MLRFAAAQLARRGQNLPAVTTTVRKGWALLLEEHHRVPSPPGRHERACPTLQGLRCFSEASAAELNIPPQFSIPGRYASALYIAAVKADKLDAVTNELSQMAGLLKQSDDFREFVSDPTVGQKVKIEGMSSVMDGLGASSTTKNFFGAREGRRRVRACRGCTASQSCVRPLGCHALDPCQAPPHADGPFPPAAALLADNSRLNQVPKILDAFQQLVAEQRGEVQAIVTAAQVRRPLARFHTARGREGCRIHQEHP